MEKLMVQMDDLERKKPDVSEYNKKGFDLGLSKDECWYVTNINEQMSVLMEEKEGYADVFDQLIDVLLKFIHVVNNDSCLQFSVLIKRSICSYPH